MSSLIRKSAGYRIFAPYRSLSQLVTSFFGSWCQGIPLALFIAWPKEIFWFSIVELCRQSTEVFLARKIVIVTLFFNRSVPQLKFTQLFFRLSSKDLSVALLSSHSSLFSFQGANFRLFWSQISKSNSLGFEIQQQIGTGGPEWARTTDLTIISRTL